MLTALFIVAVGILILAMSLAPSEWIEQPRRPEHEQAPARREGDVPDEPPRPLPLAA